jgi:hypothetical protein
MYVESGGALSAAFGCFALNIRAVQDLSLPRGARLLYNQGGVAESRVAPPRFVVHWARRGERWVFSLEVASSR